MPLGKDEDKIVEVRKPGQDYDMQNAQPETKKVSIMDMCFIEFYQHVTTIRNDNVKDKKMIRTRDKTDNLVINTFPELSPQKESPMYSEYCKYSLRKYKVVDREQDLLSLPCDLSNPS